MAANAITSAFEIRAALPSEAAVARRLVPEVFTAGAAPDALLVAHRADVPMPLGVCAIAWRPWGKPAGFPLHVHVDGTARRQGIGRALVRAAAQLCRDDTDRFHGWDAVVEGSEADTFARAVGFGVHRRTHFFDADLAACQALVDPIHARLQAYEAIPPNATVVALGDAPAREVARLVSETFDSPIHEVLANLQRPGGGFDPQYSFVLMVDGAVGGALLQRRIGDVAQVEVSVIAPALQCGWAIVVLLREAAVRGVAAGATHIRFRCDDGVHDTINLARRVRARLARTAVELSAPLRALL